MTPGEITAYMSDCTLCPRRCHADRAGGRTGFCGQATEITIARAALHFWEEPCISGSCGSGTVFFFGCSLQCVFCQNHAISAGKTDNSVTPERLAEVFLELQEEGAANINLVTPSHFIPQICRSLELAKSEGLSIPVVYNTGGYEEVSSLRLLQGLVDIWLPDLKYYSGDLADAYSHAPDYFSKAADAIGEMFRQTGAATFDELTGLMKSGVLVRHLVLPGQVGDSKRILRYLHSVYGNDIYVSIMNQYTPLEHAAQFPELSRKVTEAEYKRVLDFADKIGIENGFLQEGDTANESFIPPFQITGLTDSHSGLPHSITRII